MTKRISNNFQQENKNNLTVIILFIKHAMFCFAMGSFLQANSWQFRISENRFSTTMIRLIQFDYWQFDIETRKPGQTLVFCNFECSNKFKTIANPLVYICGNGCARKLSTCANIFRGKLKARNNAIMDFGKLFRPGHALWGYARSQS